MQVHKKGSETKCWVHTTGVTVSGTSRPVCWPGSPSDWSGVYGPSRDVAAAQITGYSGSARLWPHRCLQSQCSNQTITMSPYVQMLHLQHPKQHYCPVRTSSSLTQEDICTGLNCNGTIQWFRKYSTLRFMQRQCLHWKEFTMDTTCYKQHNYDCEQWSGSAVFLLVLTFFLLFTHLNDLLILFQNCLKLLLFVSYLV